jgi:hypothetical protein
MENVKLLSRKFYIKPSPEFSDVSDINREFNTSVGGITATAPVLIQ